MSGNMSGGKKLPSIAAWKKPITSLGEFLSFETKFLKVARENNWHEKLLFSKIFMDKLSPDYVKLDRDQKLKQLLLRQRKSKDHGARDLKRTVSKLKEWSQMGCIIRRPVPIIKDPRDLRPGQQVINCLLYTSDAADD